MMFSRLGSLPQDALSAEHEAGVAEWLSQQGFAEGVGCPGPQPGLLCIPQCASSMYVAYCIVCSQEN